MQHYAYAIRLSAALATFLCGVTATNFLGAFLPAASDGAAGREVLRVEREYVRAHLERDVATLDQVLAEDFSSFGGRVRKEHRMALLANPFFKVVSLSTGDVRVRVSGGEAWVTGKARMTGATRGREFQSPPYEYTRRLTKRDGRWQIVHMKFSLSW
ncbi:MAG: nuclear transport factor 2 family protein [Acidobacteria bacterium]|nr:nuclear transport factor 2 family protein [Acidobacteriota bacterium]